jgi:Glycosyl hydrolases family 16
MEAAVARRFILASLATTILCIIAACGTTASIADLSAQSDNAPPSGTGSSVVGSTGNCGAGAAAPTYAASAGFKELTFCDDFDSASTIDASGTGAQGFNWYTNLPSWWNSATKPAAYSVSNSVLTVTANPKRYNWGLTTMDPLTGNGNAWTFGYFEARISFDASQQPNSTGWPSFWAISAYYIRNHVKNVPDQHTELDFFEATTLPGGRFDGTLHEWRNDLSVDYWNGGDISQKKVNWSQWHIVGCLWTRGRVTWFLDGVQIMSQSYSAAKPPNPLAKTSGGINPTPAGVFNSLDLEKEGMQVVVGSEPGYPLQMDWVRVWH